MINGYRIDSQNNIAELRYNYLVQSNFHLIKKISFHGFFDLEKSCLSKHAVGFWRIKYKNNKKK